MIMDRNRVLHIVDKGTQFLATKFLEDESINNVRKTLVKCWVAFFTSLQNRMLVHQESKLWPLFTRMTHLKPFNVEQTGVEPHDSLCIARRYHQLPRQKYKKIPVEYPNVEPSLLRTLSVKELNVISGPGRIVPLTVLFEGFSRPYI